MKNINIKMPKDKYEYYDIIAKAAETDELKDIGVETKHRKTANKNKLYTFRKIHRELNDKYNLLDIAGSDEDLSKAVNIMSWLRNNSYYCGMSTNIAADNGLDILDICFGKDFDKAINCRFTAIAFADCLVAVGIKAYPVALLSYKDKENGGFACHLMTHVFLSEMNKWCLFDPSFNVYFCNEKGSLLNVFELRKLFLNGQHPIVQGYSFNGEDIHEDMYVDIFVKQCLTNITTWHDNSMIGRTYSGMNFAFRKKFNFKLPE